MLRARNDNDIRWEDLRVSLSTAKPVAGINVPTYAAFTGSNVATQQVYAWSFSSTQEESVWFEAQMPHAWAEGTNVHAHIHFAPSTAAAGNIIFGFDYTVASVSSSYTSSSVSIVTASAGGTARQHRIQELAEIDMTGQTASSILICRFYRVGDATADDYGAAVFGISCDFHYQVDDRGSITEYSKNGV